MIVQSFKRGIVENSSYKQARQPQMRKSMPTIIHIGLHKTGTSTLQDHFRKNGAIEYVERSDVQKAVVGHAKEIDRDLFIQQKRWAGTKNKTLVISHERLSGYPASGGFDRAIIAKRLVKIFPEAKILIVFRKQDTWIKSFYQQYIADGGSESINDFLTNPHPQIYKMPRFELDYLNYFELISLYNDLFGKANILALPYELMVNDFETFSESLNSFFGMDLHLVNEVINKSRPLCPLLVLRFLNGTVGKTQLSPGGFIPLGYLKKTSKTLGKIYGARMFDNRISSNWERVILEKMGDYYEKSNAELQELLGMNLSKYGYVRKS